MQWFPANTSDPDGATAGWRLTSPEGPRSDEPLPEHVGSSAGGVGDPDNNNQFVGITNVMVLLISYENPGKAITGWGFIYEPVRYMAPSSGLWWPFLAQHRQLDREHQYRQRRGGGQCHRHLVSEHRDTVHRASNFIIASMLGNLGLANAFSLDYYPRTGCFRGGVGIPAPGVLIQRRLQLVGPHQLERRSPSRESWAFCFDSPLRWQSPGWAASAAAQVSKTPPEEDLPACWEGKRGAWPRPDGAGVLADVLA